MPISKPIWKNISANGVVICNRENQQNLQKSLIERLTNTVLRCFLVKKTNFGDHKVDLQINKDKLKEYANKAKGVLWLLGTTFAAFLLYVLLVVMAVEFPSPDSSSNASETVTWGGLVIPLFLPAIFLRLTKIRLGTTATKVFTTLCTISLIMCLCAELAFFLGLISGRLKSEYLLSFIVDTSILLYLGIFVRISILFSLLVISENNKRAKQIVLLILLFLELALLTLFLFIGL